MALGAIHVLADGRPSTTLVMCPSHITHKWAREVLVTITEASPAGDKAILNPIHLAAMDFVSQVRERTLVTLTIYYHQIAKMWIACV
jgi:hypothetical protein